jgi:hypothetical protein
MEIMQKNSSLICCRSLLIAALLLCSSPMARAQSLTIELGSALTSNIGDNICGALAFRMPIAYGFSGYVGYSRWAGTSSNKQRHLDPSSGIIVENSTGTIFWGNQAFTAQALYALVNLESFRLHAGGGVFIHEKIAIDNLNANTGQPQRLTERSAFETTFTASLIGEYVHSEDISVPLRAFYAGPGFITEAKHFGCTIGLSVRLWR